jgi:hypothetical protein
MKINNLGQWEEGETEQIFEDNPTAMTTTNIELVPLLCPSR